MADISVGIIGLGRLGASVGLALKRYNDRSDANNHFSIVGADPISSVEKTAKAKGAIDKVVNSVLTAAENQDIVVIATPYAETRQTFRNIADILREGTVVFDLSPLKRPSLNWAKEFFLNDIHLIGGTAILNPIYLWDGLEDTEHAQANLFDNGSILLAPAPNANKEAVELITQLAGILGADSHFIDPDEHDGLIAATEAVPALLGVAAFRAMAASQGWSEIQRTTNPAFGRLTHRIMDTHPDDIRDLLLNNRDNTIRHLDATIEALQGLRTVLADNDTDAVEAALVGAEQDYQAWLKRRTGGAWDELIEQERPSPVGSMLSGVLGGFLANRLRGGSGEGKK